MPTPNFDDHLAVVVTRGVLFALAVAGNAFIIFLIFRSKKLRSEKFNLLLVLVAIGDIVIGFSVPVKYLADIFTRGLQWRFTCLAFGAFVVYGDHVTQLAMLFVAFDRLVVIAELAALQTTRRFSLLGIFFVLFVSVFPVAALFWNANERFDTCQLPLVWNPQYAVYMSVVSFFFNIAILGSYGIIVISYRQLMKQTSHVPLRSESHFRQIVVGIVVVYFLTWCVPKWNIITLRLANVRTIVFQVSALMVDMCEVLSACLNVVVYGYTHRDLRNAMKSTFRKIRGQKTRSTVVHSSQRIVS